MNYRLDGRNVFFTSDTHFYHRNIIDFCQRPFKSVDDMIETLISNWNKVIGADDIVFHLGDICLGDSAKWNGILDRLNGKIIILGNHDMRNFRKSYSERFEAVTLQMDIEADGQKIFLNHYPFLCYECSYDDTWQLFGHVHTNKYNIGKDAPQLRMLFQTQYDVGGDNNDLTPVSVAQVKEIIEKQIGQSNKEGNNQS